MLEETALHYTLHLSVVLTLCLMGGYGKWCSRAPVLGKYQQKTKILKQQIKLLPLAQRETCD